MTENKTPEPEPAYVTANTELNIRWVTTEMNHLSASQRKQYLRLTDHISELLGAEVESQSPAQIQGFLERVRGDKEVPQTVKNGVFSITQRLARFAKILPADWAWMSVDGKVRTPKKTATPPTAKPEVGQTVTCPKCQKQGTLTVSTTNGVKYAKVRHEGNEVHSAGQLSKFKVVA
jgi:hypothetical protein